MTPNPKKSFSSKKSFAQTTADSSSWTLGAFIDECYAQRGAVLPSGGEAGVERLKTDFAGWLDEPLNAISPWHIEAWRRDRLEESVQPAEINTRLQALSTCFRAALERRLVERNPVQELKRLKKNTEFSVELSASGSGHACLREGWSPLGINDTWTTGSRAGLQFPGIVSESDYCLKIEIAGTFGPLQPLHQRLHVVVNDMTVGQVLCRQAATYEFFVPSHILQMRERIDVVLELPDAQRPIDFVGTERDIRFLAVRVAKVELLPVVNFAPRIIMSKGAAPRSNRSVVEQRAALLTMQSLGVNCEFGFAQRSVGAEPMGLFRWTYAPIDKLTSALDKRLAGLDARDALDIQVNDASEFIVEDKLYGFRHHSFVFEAQGGTRERVQRNEYLRIGLLSKSLIEELNEQRKLFVYHDAGESPLPAIRHLLRALRSYGDNTLLWLVRAPQLSMIGTAKLIETGLIQGYVGGFQRVDGGIAPQAPHQPSWIAAACEAHDLWLASKMPQGSY